MEPPTTGSHLQQFLCALQWVKNGIPNFTDIIQPLHTFMERVYTRAGKRTKRAVARIQLATLDWGASELAVFEKCRHALANQVTLSHRQAGMRLCLYTEASDKVWSAIFTQVPREDLIKPHSEQRHQPLVFLTGKFTATQFRWAIIEKEAFAVLASLQRLHWLAATPDGFDLYTEHNNLIFLFDPLSVCLTFLRPRYAKSSAGLYALVYITTRAFISRGLIMSGLIYSDDDLHLLQFAAWFGFRNYLHLQVMILNGQRWKPFTRPSLTLKHNVPPTYACFTNYGRTRPGLSGSPIRPWTYSCGYASSRILALPAIEARHQPKQSCVNTISGLL